MNQPRFVGLGLALSALAFVGCGGGAKGTVNDYLAQASCADRGSFILSPELNRGALVDYYKAKGVNSCITKHTTIDDSDCTNAKAGEYCTVRVPGVASYDLKRTTEGFKIDWRSSQGYTPVTLGAFVAKKALGQNVDPVAVRVRAKLNSAVVGTGNVNVDLAGDDISGVSASAATDSPAGKALASVIADGKEHRVMIVVAAGSATALAITQFVQDGWHQRDDELK